MIGDSYNIMVVEGGFIVYVGRASDDQPEGLTTYRQPEPRVFADSSALINYLHNELAGA